MRYVTKLGYFSRKFMKLNHKSRDLSFGELVLDVAAGCVWSRRRLRLRVYVHGMSVVALSLRWILCVYILL